MWVEKDTEELLRQLNNMHLLTWEETTTKVRFKATYLDVITNMYSFNSDFQEIGHVTLLQFLLLFNVQNEYLEYLKRQNPSFEELLNAGWIFSCFEYFAKPWISFKIEHSTENDEIIFKITPLKDACLGCYECVGWYEDCDKDMSKNFVKNAHSILERKT